MIALVLAVLVALLLWWRGRAQDDRAATGEIADLGDEAKPRRGAKPIAADGEDERRSLLPWNRPGTSISGHITDEQGKPVGDADEPGDLQVQADAEGYAQGSKSGVAPDFAFEILMTPESVLSGRVVAAADGRPIADAQVAIEQWFWSEHSAYTDAEGYFRLDRLEPGRYKPIAKTAEGYGQIAESVLLGLGQAVDGIEIELHPTAAVRGHVMIAGETPKPCDEGSVSLTGLVSKHHARDEPDGVGAIELAALPPDTYSVEVHCTGFVAEPKYPDIVVGELSGEAQSWTVKPGLAVRGVVVDQDGKPIARARRSARVRWAPQPAPSRPRRGASKPTSAVGSS